MGALTTEIDDAVKKVGFEVLESRDVVLDALPGDTAWYHPLTPSWNIFTQRFQFTDIGKWLTTNGLKLLEFIGLAPAGTCKVQKNAAHRWTWLCPWWRNWHFYADVYGGCAQAVEVNMLW